jgi:hypothetical protein
MNIKSIFASKTFWLNVAGTALTYGGALPPKYSIPVMAVANIANRFLTNGSVNLTGN